MSKVDDGVPICSQCQILCLERFKYSTHVFFKMYRFTFFIFYYTCIRRKNRMYRQANVSYLSKIFLNFTIPQTHAKIADNNLSMPLLRMYKVTF